MLLTGCIHTRRHSKYFIIQQVDTVWSVFVFCKEKHMKINSFVFLKIDGEQNTFSRINSAHISTYKSPFVQIQSLIHILFWDRCPFMEYYVLYCRLASAFNSKYWQLY